MINEIKTHISIPITLLILGLILTTLIIALIGHFNILLKI